MVARALLDGDIPEFDGTVGHSMTHEWSPASAGVASKACPNPATMRPLLGRTQYRGLDLERNRARADIAAASAIHSCVSGQYIAKNDSENCAADSLVAICRVLQCLAEALL